jgi:PAS domain S-box-containing protein
MTLPSLTVLLIDDNATDREIFKRYLQQVGWFEYRFLECETGEEAKALLVRESPDCVLLDYQLPDADGLELLTEWTTQNFFQRFAVIMLTGEQKLDVAVQAMKAGASDYTVKGATTAEELSRTVRNAYERLQMARQIAWHQEALALKTRELEHLSRLLSRSEDRFRRFFDSNLLAIAFWSQNGQILDANQTFLELTGFTQQDLISTSLRWSTLLPSRQQTPPLPTASPGQEETLGLAPEMPIYEQSLLRKDGTELRVLLGLAALDSLDADGVAFLLEPSRLKLLDHSGCTDVACLTNGRASTSAG